VVRPTLRQLEYAVALADEGSFHRAAERCAVTQPALSTQIRQLEEALGVGLFERSRRRVLLTAAGDALVSRARALLAASDDLVAAARAEGRPLSGPLRLGVIPTVAPYLLPAALPGVRAAHPDLRLRLREDRTASLVAACRQGELDLLLLALEADLGELESEPLFRDPFVLVAPRGHRLARRRRVSEAELEGEPVLLLEDGHCLRDQTLAVCRQARAPEVADFRASSLMTLVQMVASGEGITLLPRLAVEAELSRAASLVVRPLAEPTPFRTLGLAWRPRSPRAEEFQILGRRLAAVPQDGGDASPAQRSSSSATASRPARRASRS